MLLGLVLAGSVLAIGSVHLAAILVFAPLAVVAGVVGTLGLRTSFRNVPLAAWLLLGLALYTMLQATPLPMALVRAIAPHNAEVWERARSGLGMNLGWAHLSIDPGASWVEALKWLAYAGVFLCAAFIARERGASTVLQVVFASAVGVALITLTHRITGATSLYGVYRPQYATPSFALAPLLNANNLAGYLNLGAFAGIGLVVSKTSTWPRWLVAVGVSITVGVSGLAASRGGWASLALGVPLLALLLWRAGRGQARRLVVVGLPLLAVTGGIALFLMSVSDKVLHTVRSEGLRKLDLIAWTKPMIKDHLWLGVGRGAFESAFPPYRQDIGYHVYSYAENFAAQWVSEWGLPVALAALVGFVIAMRPVARRTRFSLSAASAVVGVLVLLLHNLFDLALEVFSVAAAMFAVLGAEWGAGTRVRSGTSEAKAQRSVAVAFALVAGLAFVLSLAVGRHSARSDREDLTAQLKEAEADGGRLSAFLQQVRAAIARHPGDAYLPLLMALATDRADQNPLPWIGRAIERDPKAGKPHLALARVLARRGAKGQALLAIKMAVEREYQLTETGAELALRITRDFDALLGSVPDGKYGSSMLSALAREDNDPKLRARLLDEAIARDPELASVRYSRVDGILSSLDSKNGECPPERRRDCLARLTSLAADLARIDAGSSRQAVVGARLLIAEGRASEAEQRLSEACRTLSAPVECWRWRVVAADRAGELVPLSDAMRTYLSAVCSNSDECAKAATWLGNVASARKEWVLAVRMYERAAKESNEPAAWQRVANAATQAGLDSVALRAREKAGARRTSGD